MTQNQLHTAKSNAIPRAESTARIGVGDGKNASLDRKQEIIAATIRVIEQKGVSSASLRVIAREIGLTTGVITHYFVDKNQLMLEVLQTCFAPWAATIEEGRGLGCPWDRLRHLFVSTLPSYHQPRARVQVWLGMLQQLEREADLWRAYRSNYDALRDEVFALIQECQSSGLIRPELDPHLEGNRLFALSDGLAVSVLGEPEIYTAEVVERMMDTQFEALRPPAG